MLGPSEAEGRGTRQSGKADPGGWARARESGQPSPGGPLSPGSLGEEALGTAADPGHSQLGPCLAVRPTQCLDS